MNDVETKTEWSHLLGLGMAGELKGRKLKPLITDMVTWAAWKKQYPESTILNMSRTTHSYTREFYKDPQKFVFGFEVGGDAFALSMTQQLQTPVANFCIHKTDLVATFDEAGAVTHLFEATLDGRTLKFREVDETTMVDRETGSHWNRINGICQDGPLKGKMLTQRVGIMSFAVAWKNFHPDTQDVAFEDSAPN